MRFYPVELKRSGALWICAAASLGVASLLAGCGTVYHPVVTPITPSGPAPQPSSFAAVVSATTPDAPGVATIIDYSGDSIMAQSPIGPGPLSFTVDGAGATGYTVNSDGTLTNFQISSTLQYKNLEYSTLVNGTNALNLFSPTSGLWLADNGTNGNLLDILIGYPETFKQSIPVAAGPVLVSGPSSTGQRNYVISQIADTAAGTEGLACNTSPTTVGLNGVATPIEISTSTYTADEAIQLDPFNAANSASGSMNALCPVYAVQSADDRRLFILNRGSDTVSVINSQNNTLDQCTPFVDQTGQTVTCHPLLPLSLTAVKNLTADAAVSGAPTGIPTSPPNGTTGMGTIAGPVYAEYNPTLQELIVADYDGGTISVIDVSLDEYGNDSATFGTTYTIPVGKYPASVTVLADGSRAYTANQADETVTIVDLSSFSVEKTVPVTGHPRTVVSTENSLYGKVYVGSPDSPYLTIIRTDLDIVDTTILLEGNTVDVRVSTQNGSSGNSNVATRIPGYGQPCNLPPACYTTTALTLASCQAQPTALCTPGTTAAVRKAKLSLP
jgi:YVTN family beta-propeller protein